MWSLQNIETNLQSRIIGHQEVIREIIIAFFSGGHVLLEWSPGLWKTSLPKCFSCLLAQDYKRVQSTPDLLPSDILGVEIYDELKKEFIIKKGPIFADILFIDEINRAGPKLQSALLEAMEEKQVTIGNIQFSLPENYMVIATSNPHDHNGTYELPYAQKDRFLFQLQMKTPTQVEEIAIMKWFEGLRKNMPTGIISQKEIFEIKENIKKVVCSERMYEYIKNIIFATREHPDLIKYLETGISPRGSISILKAAKTQAYLEGRDLIIPEDIQRVVYWVLRHRLLPNYRAIWEEKTADDIISMILALVPLLWWNENF